MPVYSRTITVKEDIESAFTFTADFRYLDKWNEGDEAELITKEPIREGSIFKVKTHFNNRELELDYEIIEWGAPLRASLKTDSRNFEIVDTIFLSANAKGTELTYSVDIKYKGMFILIGLFFGPMFNKLLDTNIKNLEEILGPV